MDVNRSYSLITILLCVVHWCVVTSAAFADGGFPVCPGSEPYHCYPTDPREYFATVPAAPDDFQSLWQWHVRPRGFVYHTYWASAAEPRLGAHLVETRDQGPLLESHIGGRVGLLRFGPKDTPEGFQIDVLGGAKLRQDWDDDLDVLAADFRYDILATYGVGPDRFKLGFYHVSSHTGDEFLLKNPGFQRLNFYQDTLVAGYSFYPVAELRLYAEVGLAFHRDVSRPWEFQFGVDYGPQYPTGSQGAPFLAMNAHLREELDFGGNFALQVGWAWRGDDYLDGFLRTGLYFYDGGSPQFSFYAEHEQQIGWGVWYDY